MKDLIQTIDNSWSELLGHEAQKPYFDEIGQFLECEPADEICPSRENWFRAFSQTPVEDVKVVCCGQDPYFNGEAMGLSFSIKHGMKLTRSLSNILKEVTGEKDVKHYSGDLSGWANQGVLLLNSSLTTRRGQAGAHKKAGWRRLTSSVLEHLNKQDQPIVYLAWGTWAHDILRGMDNPNQTVIKTSHPSPLGARKTGEDFCAFLRSGCFAQANQFLAEQGSAPIDWLGGLKEQQG